MSKKQIATIDDDVKQLIHLLLRKHAVENADFQRYNNISDQLSFEIANRGLRAFSFREEAPKPVEPKK